MSKKWTSADLADQSGKTFVITGAAGGIGLVAARELARAGANVVMAVRNERKGVQAAASIGRVRGHVDVRQLDVASLASIRKFADSWTGRLDVLINNAGIMMVPHAVTNDGLESQMATNYFGPFALTNALLPHISDRIVSVSSQLHRLGRMRGNNLKGDNKKYNPWFAYCDSKLNILLFSYELNRRLVAAHSHVRSVIAHPGIAKTNLVSHVGGVSGWLNGLAQPLLNEAENGGLPTLYAATENIAANAYIGPDGFGSIKGYPKVRRPSPSARNVEAAAKLWNATIEIIGPEFDLALSEVHDHREDPS